MIIIEPSIAYEASRIERLVKDLEGFVLFKNFTRTAKQRIIPKMKNIKLYKGQVLFREKDKLEYIYLVKDGQLSITKTINLYSSNLGKYFNFMQTLMDYGLNMIHERYYPR